MVSKFPNLVIAGPCGVGKSLLASTIADKWGKIYLDFDKLGIIDMNKRKGEISPFSNKYLNLPKCLSSLIIKPSNEFILDIGGDTVFRKNVDNIDRQKQINMIKKMYNALIILLTANRNILHDRFISTKTRTYDEFIRVWNDWEIIGKPNWIECKDIVVDTSQQSVQNLIEIIESNIN